jgi:hypothetical protein
VSSKIGHRINSPDALLEGVCQNRKFTDEPIEQRLWRFKPYLKRGVLLKCVFTDDSAWERLGGEFCRPQQGYHSQDIMVSIRLPETLVEFTLEREVVWPVQPRTTTRHYSCAA